MKRLTQLAGVVLAVVFFTGCSSMVAFKSEPAGATVTCDGCRGWGDSDDKTPIGVTPFDFRVYDKAGWFSKYSFTAVLKGYKPAVQTVEEKDVVDGTSFGFFPDTINFKMQK